MAQAQLNGELREGTCRYNTPLSVVSPIAEAVGGFDLDPCASDDSNLADTNIRNSGGLKADWGEFDTVWLNHPYASGEPSKWLGKAAESDSETIVALSKADPSTNWFHDYIFAEANLISFPATRFQFVGENNGANFPSVFSVFGTVPEQLDEHLETLGCNVRIE